MSINVKDGSSGAAAGTRNTASIGRPGICCWKRARAAGEAIDIRACSDEATEKAVYHRGTARREKQKKKRKRLVIFSVSLG
jgi:hypothetical protein